MNITVLIILFGLSLSSSALADAGFYEKKAEGWHWYEPVPEEPDEPEMSPPPEPLSAAGAASVPEPAPAAVTQPAPSGPAPFSAAWLRDKLPELRDRAIDQPTPDNVRAYFYSQRVAVDKAERFALAAQRVVMTDPVLDENARRPIASAGGWLMDRVARENRDALLEKLADIAGLWFFFASYCPYCHAQAPVLERIQTRYGFQVLPISLDNRPMPGGFYEEFVPDAGHAERLGVKSTPTIFLMRPPNDFVTVAQGVVSQDELLDRILLAALEAGWIDEGSYDGTRPVDRSTTIAVPAGAGGPAPQEPRTLVEYLRRYVRQDR